MKIAGHTSFTITKAVVVKPLGCDRKPIGSLAQMRKTVSAVQGQTFLLLSPFVLFGVELIAVA